MTEQLDRLLSQLAAAPTDRNLDGLDLAVAHSIARRRAELQTSRALTPVRVASVGLALAIGVSAGSMVAASAATAPRQSSIFSTAAHLAPSTLLEGAG